MQESNRPSINPTSTLPRHPVRAPVRVLVGVVPVHDGYPSYVRISAWAAGVRGPRSPACRVSSSRVSAVEKTNSVLVSVEIKQLYYVCKRSIPQKKEKEREEREREREVRGKGRA